jgi:hypothetical protein
MIWTSVPEAVITPEAQQHLGAIGGGQLETVRQLGICG